MSLMGMLTNMRRLLVLGPKQFSQIPDAQHYSQDESELLDTNPCNDISDDGAIAIAEALKVNNSLQKLWLSDTIISD